MASSSVATRFVGQVAAITAVLAVTLCPLGAAQARAASVHRKHSNVNPHATTPGFQYVALGDSVAAGEGLQNLPAPNPCHRSTSSYPYLVARDAALHITSFRSVACTGATTSQVLDHNQSVNGAVVAPQLSQIAGSRPTIVTLTAGQDDLQGWDNDVAQCMTWGLNKCVRYQGDVDNAANDIGARIPTIIARLRAAGASQILVTGYYDPFPAKVPPAKGSSCDATRRFFLGQRLNDHTVQLLVDYLGEINNAISSAARRSGATYVNLEAMIPQANRVCSASPWVFSFNPGFVKSKAAMHPTAPGQKKIAQLVEAKITPLTAPAHPIAVLANVAGTEGVYTMNADGSGVTLLPGAACTTACVEDADINPQPVAWNLSHTALAYIDSSAVHWASADGSSNRVIAQTDTQLGEIAVSPDSQTVAVVGLDQQTSTSTVLHWEIMLAHTDGSAPTQLTDLPANCEANGIRWTPNGARLILGLQCSTGGMGGPYNDWSVASTPSSGAGGFSTIVSSEIRPFSGYAVGDLSTDGGTIFLEEGGNVETVPITGGSITTLVSTFPSGYAAVGVVVSPDGSQIIIPAFSVSLQQWGAFVANSDGSGLTMLPAGTPVSAFDW